MKPSKYSLLNKNDKEDQDDDEVFGNNQFRPKQYQETPYTQLKDQKKDIKISKPSGASSIQASKMQASNAGNKKPMPPPATVYNIPNVNNSVVNIGPYGVSIQPRIPYVPPVVIDCEKCKAKQQIPGNTHEFICCGCHEMSKVEPTFGLFVCGVCRNHVCYPYRTSEHIQCNYCHTVNKVPLSPVGSSKVRMEDKSQSEPILPKDLREDIQLQDIELVDVTTGRGEEAQQR